MNHNTTFYAAGLGTPEIILILISCLIVFAFLGWVIFLIDSAMNGMKVSHNGEVSIQFLIQQS